MKALKFWTSLFSTAVLALGLNTSASAAGFSDEVVAKNPCLNKVFLPDNPTEYKPMIQPPTGFGSWSGMYSGLWGNSLCHVLVVKKIDDSGNAEVFYSTGKPFFGGGPLSGKVESSGASQIMTVKLAGGGTAIYTLDKDPVTGQFFINGNFRNNSVGKFYPVLSF